jgi:DNA-binding response OmpR family regulator
MSSPTPPESLPLRVLTADDDPVTLRLLSTLLGDWGYDVLYRSNGREAYDCWAVDPSVRLAILDWMMPPPDGPELCRMIRAGEKHRGMTYLILLTGRGRSEDVVQGLDAGANDFITKPFDHEELRSRVSIGRRMVELQSQLAARVRELEQALQEIKTLQGLLPICMHCHKIRDSRSDWTRLEEYVSAHSGAKFSHGICPDCLKKHYPEKI